MEIKLRIGGKIILIEAEGAVSVKVRDDVALAVVPSVSYAEGASALAGFGGLMPLIFIFIFFYLFLIRPQQKKAKDHQNLLNTLKKGDKVVTSGGIYAVIAAVRENIVEIKVADGVNLQIDKQAVATVLPNGNDADVKVPEVVKK